jgi:hypothetical protein
MTETIVICTIFGVFLILSFVIGARVGQKIVKGEEVKVEMPNPIKAIEKHLETKAIEKEADKLSVMMENIDNYDGTDLGQKEIPK